MSRPNKAPNDTKTIKKIVDSLGGLSIIEKIYVFGSRSPRSEREPKDYADWDLFVLTKSKHPVILPNFRNMGVAHVDIVTADKRWLEIHPEATEIYPTDKYNVLK